MVRTRSQIPTAAVAFVPRRSPRIRKMRDGNAQNTRAQNSGNTPRRMVPQGVNRRRRGATGNQQQQQTTTTGNARRIGDGIRQFQQLLNSRNQVQPHPRPHSTNFRHRIRDSSIQLAPPRNYHFPNYPSFPNMSVRIDPVRIEAPRPTPRVGTATVRIPRISGIPISEVGAPHVSTLIDRLEEQRRAMREDRTPPTHAAARTRPIIPWGRPAGVLSPRHASISTHSFPRPEVASTAIDAEETFWRDIFTFDILNWEHRNLGLNEQQISELPKKTFRRTRSSRHDSCHVCLVDFTNAEKLNRLPKCGHEFHPECLKPWVDRHTTCPVCRQSILRG